MLLSIMNVAGILLMVPLILKQSLIHGGVLDVGELDSYLDWVTVLILHDINVTLLTEDCHFPADQEAWNPHLELQSD